MKLREEILKPIPQFVKNCEEGNKSESEEHFSKDE